MGNPKIKEAFSGDELQAALDQINADRIRLTELAREITAEQRFRASRARIEAEFEKLTPEAREELKHRLAG